MKYLALSYHVLTLQLLLLFGFSAIYRTLTRSFPSMMASTNPFKGSKWFSHKSLAKSLHRLRRLGEVGRGDEIDGFRELFCRLDSDGDGRISSEELRSFMGGQETKFPRRRRRRWCATWTMTATG
ncbi:hypothetical protein HPP92_003144 [Vanilla planifolia]|uniref:EF-hand domain-containing protein n=1 Tax=Vanilla planifolia TaxID=51239 RepID=A0A835SFX2_VANPL|nr:hypothetical protein HPP92_003144 [Vanilla planifolia]